MHFCFLLKIMLKSMFFSVSILFFHFIFQNNSWFFPFYFVLLDFHPWRRIALTWIVIYPEMIWLISPRVLSLHTIKFPLNPKMKESSSSLRKGSETVGNVSSCLLVTTSLLRNHRHLSVFDALLLVLSTTEGLLLPDITAHHFWGDPISLVRSHVKQKPDLCLLPIGYGHITLWAPLEPLPNVIALWCTKELPVAQPSILILPLSMKLIFPGFSF